MRVVVSFVILVALVAAGACAAGRPSSRARRGVQLVAVAACTQALCPNRACCNSCTFTGWVDAKRGLRAVAAPGAAELPSCAVDGCGRCDFALVADGSPGPDETFVVSAWRRR